MIPEQTYYDPELDGKCGKETAVRDGVGRSADGQVRAFGSEEEFEQAKEDGYGLLMVNKLPEVNCRKCLGRGHLGYDTVSKQYIPCECVI